MRIKLPRPQDGPTGLVTVLCGDDLGVGLICYLGPFAFISEDERKEVDHGFWPEMRYALAAKLKREHWRIAIFCPGWIYHRVEPISYFVTFGALTIAAAHLTAMTSRRQPRHAARLGGGGTASTLQSSGLMGPQ